MKVIVLDTNILIDNVHGFAPWVDVCLADSKNFLLIVPTIVVAEYHTARELETKEGSDKSRKYLALFRMQDLNVEIAEVLGEILRRKNYVTGADLADLIIAATALFLNAELATRNKADFVKIPHLRFFDPKQYRLKE